MAFKITAAVKLVQLPGIRTRIQNAQPASIAAVNAPFALPEKKASFRASAKDAIFLGTLHKPKSFFRFPGV
jgi:hypothetical protein